MTAQEKRSSPVVLIVAWLIVGLPGAWGVEQTLVKSFDLFRAPVPAASPASAKPAPQPGTTPPTQPTTVHS